jgi:hypothetical protein
MSPVTHLLASWIIAAKTTDNPRDCRLVTLAGVLPDVDGLGLLVDGAKSLTGPGDDYYYYSIYHHWLLHGLFGSLLTAGLLTCFARRRWRVLLLALMVFHLHLLCDLVGARGPTPYDLWPIYYLGPFSRHWTFVWHGQWPLNGWINRVITVVLFFIALWMASRREDSVVGVFNRRVDRVFLGVLHKWRLALTSPSRTEPNPVHNPGTPRGSQTEGLAPESKPVQTRELSDMEKADQKLAPLVVKPKNDVPPNNLLP